MMTYENRDLGIAFEYPSEWASVYNCRVRYGVDILMSHGFTNFGIMRVCNKIKNDAVSNGQALKEILRSIVQLNEVTYEDVHFNKYVVRDSYTATIAVNKKSETMANTMIVEKTLVVYAFDNIQTLLVVLEDTPENYESGNSQSQLRQIFDSFRFVC